MILVQVICHTSSWTVVLELYSDKVMFIIGIVFSYQNCWVFLWPWPLVPQLHRSNPTPLLLCPMNLHKGIHTKLTLLSTVSLHDIGISTVVWFFLCFYNFGFIWFDIFYNFITYFSTIIQGSMISFVEVRTRDTKMYKLQYIFYI